MKLNLMPRKEIFFELFKEASDNLVEAAKIFHKVLESPQKAHEISKEIKMLEKKGDDIVDKISDRLKKPL